MADSSRQGWPEAIVSTTEISRAVSRAVKAGQLRKLASRLYTRNFKDSPQAIIQRNLWQIIGGYFPGALIADRTALENMPAPDGSVCLVAKTGVNVKLPGLVLRPRRGHSPLPSDRPFVGGLYLSSTARTFLENLRPSRARGNQLARTLGRTEIETRLEQFLRLGGDKAINRLRDEIKAIAPKLKLKKEGKLLDALIGTLLGTRDAVLKSPAARARRVGRPFDPNRLAMFTILHKALREQPPVIRPAARRSREGLTTLAFFEAYFSNFIEGTEFEVEEAADIVFRGMIPKDRPQDAHDILGTYRVITDDDDIGRLPRKTDEFLSILRRRHHVIMESRLDKSPGQFKTVRNRAGLTVFVEPELVEETLRQGFEIHQSLDTAFARAVFMMFLVSEVHPFADGNGRIARIMMNAELVAGGEERIIIPTVYRENYLAALRALSRTARPEPLIRTLDFAQRWTAIVDWRQLETTRQGLEACHAFLSSAEAEKKGLRLRLPDQP